MSSTPRFSIAIGPELPEFGSWNWLGEPFARFLSRDRRSSTYASLKNLPAADCVLFLKFKPSIDTLLQLRHRSLLVWMPVDVVGHCHEIDGDLGALGLLDLVLTHSQRLLRYFRPFVRAEFVDHPLRFHLPQPRPQPLAPLQLKMRFATWILQYSHSSVQIRQSGTRRFGTILVY